MAAHAVGPPARPDRPLAARRRNRRHRARPRPRRALERPDQGPEIFSVAQHSLLVEALYGAGAPQAPHSARLAALLHDAPEYVIGDMISPFKAAVGGDYKKVEERLLSAIFIRFGLPAHIERDPAKAIKAADREAAYLEATHLAGFSVAEACKLFGEPKVALKSLKDYLQPMRPNEAQERFLVRFHELDAAARA